MLKIHACLIAALFFGFVIQEKEKGPWKAPTKLDVEKPFRDAATENMAVETHVDRDGKVVVQVTLRDIKLTAGMSTSLPASLEVRGDWVARFVVTPKYSAEDFKALNHMLEKRRPQSKDDLGSELFAANPYLAPNVSSKGHAYSIQVAPYVPSEESERMLVKEFIRKLSTQLTAYGEHKSETILTWWILD